jgi:hypothetical protein
VRLELRARWQHIVLELAYAPTMFAVLAWWASSSSSPLMTAGPSKLLQPSPEDGLWLNGGVGRQANGL